jgi:hypothetical protein
MAASNGGPEKHATMRGSQTPLRFAQKPRLGIVDATDRLWTNQWAAPLFPGHRAFWTKPQNVCTYVQNEVLRMDSESLTTEQTAQMHASLFRLANYLSRMVRRNGANGISAE